ncbi:MAG: hypothetical protein JSR44_09320 [Spirochaetes bacterium]|nr:hypothetical protein [Spirochaetota bacterium]
MRQKPVAADSRKVDSGFLNGQETEDADSLRPRQSVVNILFAGRGGLEAVKASIAENY